MPAQVRTLLSANIHALGSHASVHSSPFPTPFAFFCVPFSPLSSTTTTTGKDSDQMLQGGVSIRLWSRQCPKCPQCHKETGLYCQRCTCSSRAKQFVELWIQIEKPADVIKAKRLIFPGVGSFGAAMDVIARKGYVQPLVEYIQVDSCALHRARDPCRSRLVRFLGSVWGFNCSLLAVMKTEDMKDLELFQARNRCEDVIHR